MTSNLNLLLTQVLPASITCCFSGSVVLTYFFFPELRQLRYIELVFYISINDLFANIGVALGETRNNSAACWYQGLSTNVNILSSLFWTVVITYQVWLIVHRGSVIKDLTYIHIFCWGVPIIVSLIPLSTNTYGNNDDHPSWCFIANTSYSPSWGLLVWELLSFYIWVWLAYLVSVILCISTYIRLKNMQVVSEVARSTMSKLALYPVTIFICWTFNTLTVLYFSAGNGNSINNIEWVVLNDIGLVLAIFQGLLFAVIFFSMNPLVRLQWKLLFFSILTNFFQLMKYKDELDNIRLTIQNGVEFNIEDQIDYIPPTTVVTRENPSNLSSSQHLTWSGRDSRISARLSTFFTSTASLSNASSKELPLSEFERETNNLTISEHRKKMLSKVIESETERETSVDNPVHLNHIAVMQNISVHTESASEIQNIANSINVVDKRPNDKV